MSSNGVHAGDDEYTSRTGQKQKEEVPVQSDNDAVEDPVDSQTADSDAQLGKPYSNHGDCNTRKANKASRER